MGLRTVREAAGTLGVGYSTLKLWINQGHVRTTRTAGGHHRLSDAEIDRLAAHQGASPAARAAMPSGSYLDGLSARNRLFGHIEEVRVDGLLAQVRLRVGDQRLTAVITRDAIDALGLKRGDDAFAVIKSTEVMMARVEPPGVGPRGPSNARKRSR